MPWDLYIKHSDTGRSLGSVDEVEQCLRTALPTIEFYKEPSGAEKLKTLEDQGVEVPDILKENFLRSRCSYMGVINGNDFSIEFCLGQDPAVECIVVEVRGGGDPMPSIEKLTRIQGWVVRDSQSREPTKAGWQQFARWRDDAIESVRDTDGT